MALLQTPPGELGSICPDFELPAIDGKVYRLNDFRNKKPFVVMFICSHCPYVQAIETRLIELGIDLKKMSVNLIAINSNDAESYPEDSFENMKNRAEQKSYSFVYLHDSSQEVAKKFGAVCTPDFFVYDGDSRLSYRGRLDDSWKDASKVTKRELFDAVRRLLRLSDSTASTSEAFSAETSTLAIHPQHPSMGCSIKWKKN
jgi:thiol-disulfide isomerase/thioredoxin